MGWSQNGRRPEWGGSWNGRELGAAGKGGSPHGREPECCEEREGPEWGGGSASSSSSFILCSLALSLPSPSGTVMEAQVLRGPLVWKPKSTFMEAQVRNTETHVSRYENPNKHFWKPKPTSVETCVQLWKLVFNYGLLATGWMMTAA